MDEGVTFTARTFTPSTIDATSLELNPEVDDWVLARGSDNSVSTQKIKYVIYMAKNDTIISIHSYMCPGTLAKLHSRSWQTMYILLTIING